MKTIKKIVIINFDIEGFHNYPNAPKKVNFLKFKHRHLFNIKVGYLVINSDREKEIFIQTDFIREYLNECFGFPCQFNSMSCEMIAEEILAFASEDSAIWCEVLEDGKGGARVEL